MSFPLKLGVQTSPNGNIILLLFSGINGLSDHLNNKVAAVTVSSQSAAVSRKTKNFLRHIAKNVHILQRIKLPMTIIAPYKREMMALKLYRRNFR
jgi:hypothetical protein